MSELLQGTRVILGGSTPEPHRLKFARIARYTESGACLVTLEDTGEQFMLWKPRDQMESCEDSRGSSAKAIQARGK